ncbi:MAG: fatty acid desaturase [Candidatus Omnitrophota bacterium]|nr:fatty acid desaturase [Candidatus Omnitrophota bacterium]
MDIPSFQTKYEQLWQKIVAKYQNPHRAKSIGQLLNTLIPYVLLWGVMVYCLTISYWLVLPVAFVAAGLLVRIFIIFHDCGHGSFFKSQKANHFWGFITGVLTFTPYQYWRHEHSVHHSHSGDLDHRGVGEVWTMTVDEYLHASRWMRIKYRFARNPICLFIIGPTILFLIVHRLPLGPSGRDGHKSVHLTNLSILVIAVAMSFLIGFKAYVLIQLPVLMIAASAGIWLFYVQHQFEGVYWERNAKWDYVTEALKGSSFFKMPKVLQWFTGNIGFHHIHHLSPRIPNYFLERCYKENPMFQQIKPITLLTSLKSLTFRLWDEQHNRLVGFGYLRTLKYS